jgi:serine/threonine-protein kinase
VRAPSQDRSEGAGFDLSRRLARGASAEVWLARPRGQGRTTVVLKTLVPTPETESLVDAIAARADRATTLVHPNLARVVGTGELGEAIFVASEYVWGRTLGQIRRAIGARGLVPPLWFTLSVFAALCDGLAYAHEKVGDDGAPLDLAHGALHPELFTVTFGGVAKVLDLGLAMPPRADAKPTGPKRASYLAPESAGAEPAGRATARGDVYSLGVALYELLTGRHPHRSVDGGSSARPGDREVTPPSRVAPWVPETLDSVLLTALAVMPANRYESAGQLRDALEAQLQGMGQHVTPHNLATYVLGLFGHAWLEEPSVSTGIPAGQVPGAGIHTTDEDGDEPARVKGADPARPVEVETVLAAHDLAAWSRHAANDELSAPHPELTSSRSARTPTPPPLAPPSPPPPSPSPASARPEPVTLSVVVPPAPATPTIAAAPPTSPQPRRGPLLAAVALLVVAAAAGAASLPRRVSSAAPSQSAAVAPSAGPQGTATAAAATDVELVVIASPPEAKLFLDDAALSDNPFRARVPRDQRLHRVRCVAAGYTTAEEAVTFERDLTVRVTLHAELVDAGPPGAKGKLAKPNAGADEYPAAPQPAQPAQPAAPATAAATAPHPKEGDDLRKSLPPVTKAIDRKDPYAP